MPTPPKQPLRLRRLEAPLPRRTGRPRRLDQPRGRAGPRARRLQLSDPQPGARQPRSAPGLPLGSARADRARKHPAGGHRLGRRHARGRFHTVGAQRPRRSRARLGAEPRRRDRRHLVGLGRQRDRSLFRARRAGRLPGPGRQLHSPGRHLRDPVARAQPGGARRARHPVAGADRPLDRLSGRELVSRRDLRLLAPRRRTAAADPQCGRHGGRRDVRVHPEYLRPDLLRPRPARAVGGGRGLGRLSRRAVAGDADQLRALPGATGGVMARDVGEPGGGVALVRQPLARPARARRAKLRARRGGRHARAQEIHPPARRRHRGQPGHRRAVPPAQQQRGVAQLLQPDFARANRQGRLHPGQCPLRQALAPERGDRDPRRARHGASDHQRRHRQHHVRQLRAPGDPAPGTPRRRGGRVPRAARVQLPQGRDLLPAGRLRRHRRRRVPRRVPVDRHQLDLGQAGGRRPADRGQGAAQVGAEAQPAGRRPRPRRHRPPA